MKGHRKTHRQTHISRQHRTGGWDPLSFLIRWKAFSCTRHLPASQQAPDLHWTSCARHLPASQQVPDLHWTSCARHLPALQQVPDLHWTSCTRHLPALQQALDLHWTSCTRHLPASQQTLDLHWTFLDLPEHWCYYLSFSPLFQRTFFPSQGILDEPPNVLPVVRVPGRERRLLETMQLAIGEFITDSRQGLPPSPRV